MTGGQALAQPATTFHPLGDLAGGPTISIARDATKVGDTIYVVGASGHNIQILCTAPNTPPGCVGSFSADTPVLWTVTGNAVTITALPDLVSPGTPPTNAAFASAITRDAAYIASQARSSAAQPAQTGAVRVTRNGLVNLNLSAPPFPPPTSSAVAISDDGSVLWGFAGGPSRVNRYDINANMSKLVPLVDPADNTSSIPARGASADGLVAVGTSGVFPLTNTSGRAFRYVHASPVGTTTAIPLLPGGTWNRGVAVSSDGRFVLVSGNSTTVPNGELYVYDANTAAITRLGSANTPWSPLAQAGITSDGAVVVATFLDVTSTDPVGTRMAYVHNAHGWFHLATILGARGTDLTGWDIEHMQVTGISPDGTLVYGQALHNDNLEAFVAEFPAGDLASFDMPAVPQTDPRIIGVWTSGDPNDHSAFIFGADGTYIQIDPSHGTPQAGEFKAGFERGRYFWDPATGLLSFLTLQDTNGSVGLSGANGIFPGLPATITGDTLDVFNGGFILKRLTGSPNSLVGGWVLGDPRIDDSFQAYVFFADGSFIFADDVAADGPNQDGIRAGTYTVGADGKVTLNVTLDTVSNGTTGTVPTDLRLLPDNSLGIAGSTTHFERIVARQYFLSEGATSAFFDEDVLIANPNTVEAPITLTFLKSSGAPIVQNRTLPPQSRTTVHVDQIAGLEGAEVSTVVTSTLDLPLVVERSMFWDSSYYAGHTGSSIGQPAQDWVFAEGSQGFFSTYVLLANANTTPTDVTLTFLREADTPVVQQVTVPASARLTVDCATIPGIVNRSFGITVHGSQPIIAERAMYFGSTGSRLWSGGHESAGVTSPSKTWFLAEGATGGFFDTFILLSNPQDADANVTIQFLLDNGQTVTEQKTVGAHQRLTINIEAEPDPRLANAAVSTVVTSDVAIVAERSMYWIGDVAPWAESHNSFGVVEASTHWGLAEGRVGQDHNFHTYILLANPQTTAAEVTVTFLRETGAPIVKTYTVPPTSRFNIDVNAVSSDLHDENLGADVLVTNGVPIVVERSLYWDWQGVLFKGGTNATGIALP